MADQLATAADLESLLGTTLDAGKATLLLEMATAIVQGICGGQRIVQVVDDELTLTSYSDSWLSLPQIPVTSVSSVTIDGDVITDWKLFGDKLFRKIGWQNDLGWQNRYGWPGYGYYDDYWSGFDPVTGAHTTSFGQQPSTVVVVCTHGYPTGAQELQLGRSAVLSLAATGYNNPTGATSEHIDDYSVSFDAMSARMEASTFLKAQLRKQYGRRAGVVRIG